MFTQLLMLATSAIAQHGGFIPAPKVPESGLALTKQYRTRPTKTEFATFAAGCFWGVEHEFRSTPGVVATMVGFSGGHVPNPSYKQVCYSDTGHAEAVRVEYDPNKVSYTKLLQVFWDYHDPTTPNRQGPDVGEQYRSVVFFHSKLQKKLALETGSKLEKSNELGGAKIVTEFVPAQAFFRAEEYHQQYIEKGGNAYCHPRKKHS